MKKRFLVFLLSVLLLAVACSCRSAEQNDDPASDGVPPSSTDNAGVATTDGCIYSSLTTPVIVYNEGGASGDSALAIANKIYLHTDKVPEVVSATTEKSDHEIVLGKTDRKISLLAYDYLERIERETETSVRYLIYSDGDSVAIAYDDEMLGLNAAEEEAVGYFVDGICIDASLTMSKGVAYSGSFCVIERQSQEDQAALDTQWTRAADQLTELYGKEFSDDAIKSLKQLYSLYTDGAVEWIADLYDQGVGGFYYSNSARNTEGFLPDLESTYQAIALISSTGMLGKYGLDAVSGMPEWFGEQVVAFVKGLQDSENGYFYHPQWTKALSNSNLARLGRDLTHATKILSMYGAKPTYDTPNGVVGDGILADGTPVVAQSALSQRLSQSVVSAVSIVVAANDSDSATPVHMRSESAFRAYLSGLDINGNSYYVGNQLESQSNQIAARDRYLEETNASYRLADILEEWLNAHQYESTGLWARGGATDYEAINGLLKISSTYSRIGKPVPNAAKGLSNAIKALSCEDPIRHVCDILNPWYAIAILTQNIKNYSTDTSEMDKAMEELISNYSSAIEATVERLTVLYREDGSFGYLPNSSSPTSQNMPVAVPDTLEGDVNATYIAISSIPQHIFNAVGIDYILPYTEADRLTLISILEGNEPVIKDERLPAEVATFDYDKLGEMPTEVETVVNSSGSITVTKDPAGKSNQVLKFVSKADGAGKGADEIYVNVADDRIGSSCYSFELDMYVSSESREGYFTQINMGLELFMLQIGKKNGKVIAVESSSSNSSYAVLYDIGPIADLDEWFNLRIEYYPADADNVRIKIYVDGELLAVSDNFYDHRAEKLNGNGVPNVEFSETRINVFSDVYATIYIDNVISDRSSDIYEPISDPDNQPMRNVDAPDAEKRVVDFDNGEFPDGSVAINSPEIQEVNGEKLLYLSTAGACGLEIPAFARGSGANAAVFEATVGASADTPAGAKLGVGFYEFGTNAGIMAGIHFVVREDDNGRYLEIAEGLGSSTGAVISEERISFDAPLNIRIEYFFKTSTTAVYVNGALMAATLTSATGSNCKYFANVKISTVTAAGAGGFYIDDLCTERVKCEEFKEKEGVSHDFDNGLGEVTSLGEVTVYGGAAVMGGNGTQIKVPVNLRSAAKAISSFEFGISLDSEFYAEGAMRILLGASDGRSILAYDIVGEGDKLAIYEVTENGRYSTPIAEISSVSEFKVKYSRKLGVSIIYVDGVCVATSDLAYSDGAFAYNYEYASLILLNEKTNVSVSYCVAEISMQEFVVDTPISNPDDVNEQLGFESSSSVDLPASLGKFELLSAGVRASVREIIINQQRTKMFSFVTTSGGKDIFNVFPTVRLSDCNTAIFESDMILNTDVNSTGFDIEPLNGDYRAYKITVTLNGGKVYMQGYTSNGADPAFPMTEVAKVGEPFRLRVEYSNLGADYNGDGVTDIRCAVYVNGSEEPIGVGSSPYYSDESRIYEARQLTSIRFFTWTNTDMEFLLDNIYVGGTDDKYAPPAIPEEPEIDIPEGDGIGNGGYDGTGWTD